MDSSYCAMPLPYNYDIQQTCTLWYRKLGRAGSKPAWSTDSAVFFLFFEEREGVKIRKVSSRNFILSGKAAL